MSLEFDFEVSEGMGGGERILIFLLLPRVLFSFVLLVLLVSALCLFLFLLVSLLLLLLLLLVRTAVLLLLLSLLSLVIEARVGLVLIVSGVVFLCSVLALVVGVTCFFSSSIS